MGLFRYTIRKMLEKRQKADETAVEKFLHLLPMSLPEPDQHVTDLLRSVIDHRRFDDLDELGKILKVAPDLFQQITFEQDAFHWTGDPNHIAWGDARSLAVSVLGNRYPIDEESDETGKYEIPFGTWMSCEPPDWVTNQTPE